MHFSTFPVVSVLSSDHGDEQAASTPKAERFWLRQLLVMRHAKSDWDAGYAGDHERPLNDRGVRSARLMGRLLAGHGQTPALVVSSTAVRARSTAELAVEAGSWASPIQLERGLYEWGPEGVIERAARAPDVERLMLVGHQPTWSLVVEHLTGERTDLKTASVAVIDFDVGSWSELPRTRGELIAVHDPRSHFGTSWDEG